MEEDDYLPNGHSALSRAPTLTPSGAGRVGHRVSTNSDGFQEDPLDSFLDDDSLMTSQIQDDESLAAGMDGANFIERDDFDAELGSPSEDPFSEDFSSVSKFNIIDVVGDDRAGRPVIVLYAYRLPNSKTFDHDKLLRYFLHVLDKFVNQDYTIIYFHYGLRSHNKPPIKWLFRAYKILDRRYKKNLKALFLVHPTKFIRVVWNLFQPIISHKFKSKLHYVNFLSELAQYAHTDQLQLPQVIQEHDKQLIEAAVATRNYYTQQAVMAIPEQQFGVSLQYIMENHPGHDVPPIVTDLLAHLRAHALGVEGIFRRSANLHDLRKIQEDVNKGQSIHFILYEVHLSAVLLKTFLRELTEPVMTFDNYDPILAINDWRFYGNHKPAVADKERANACRALIRALPAENARLLRALVEFLVEVAAHSTENLMDASNLSVVFGPNLAWPRDGQVSLADLHKLNLFCYRLIQDYRTIFDEPRGSS